MKILIVCSGNVDNFKFDIHQAFIYEQIEEIKKLGGVDYDTYFIKGKGINGYLSNYKILKSKIKQYNPDIIHAHYGLSGLLAVLILKQPVVITYHGSDCSNFKNIVLSNISHLFSKYSIFVNISLFKKLKIKIKHKTEFVKCGIDMSLFLLTDKESARKQIGLSLSTNYILFSSAFDNTVKNYDLARKALIILNKSDLTVIELKDKSREDVNLLLNAVDLMLLTSVSEGSPQIIKEAMACNCPIVATDVGDIKEIIAETDGCYITSFEPNDVAIKIKMALDFSEKTDRTNGRTKVQYLDNKITAQNVFNVYKKVLENENSNI